MSAEKKDIPEPKKMYPDLPVGLRIRDTTEEEFRAMAHKWREDAFDDKLDAMEAAGMGTSLLIAKQAKKRSSGTPKGARHKAHVRAVPKQLIVAEGFFRYDLDYRIFEKLNGKALPPNTGIGKAVLKLSPELEVIQEYKNAAAAIQDLGDFTKTTYGNISRALKTAQRLLKGFYWIRKCEYEAFLKVREDIRSELRAREECK